ncbi:TFIIB-type zinc ribbon-containing protein [Psychrobacillus sp. FSL K6-1415]|uniref:TFIIB-type zinc ribbon-containing protein n=1 Tax=Psychrobacillus sp. FSL K6-1415 TaxID=2921544 RepID=UPI0030FAA856
MTDTNISFSIPLDDDGFVTLQCPFCNSNFKLTGTDAMDDSVYETFCPYCGLVAEPNQFLTDEVIEKAMRLAENHMFEMLNGFQKNIEKSFKKNRFLKVKTSPKLKMNSPKLIVESDNMETYNVPCCEKDVKLSIIDDTLYCPFCGGETNGNIN